MVDECFAAIASGAKTKMVTAARPYVVHRSQWNSSTLMAAGAVVIRLETRRGDRPFIRIF
jgi:hypothetical protein